VGFESQSLNPLLTSRGRYEVRSGRAIHKEVLPSGNTKFHIGGALKASIGSEGAIQTGEGVEVRVTAAIRYAKFVEFPTTHNAAQPFLLPALHDNRERLRKEVANEIKRRLGG
jgi:HK97 gp10 family phage protein